MSCLDDIKCGNRTIIGIRDFDECPNPESGYFINDLPQISFKAASKIANSDIITARELLKNCIRLGTMFVFDEFTQENAFIKWIDDVAVIAQPQFTTTKQAPAAAEKGILLRRYRSEIGQLFISSVVVKAANSGTTKIKIKEGYTSNGTFFTSKTTEFEIDLVADQEVEKVVNYRAKTEEILVVIDNTSFSMYDCPVNSVGNGRASCVSCSGKSMDVYVAGWNGTTTDNSCHGIKVMGTVRCFEDNLLCSLIGKMGTLFLYRAGIVFLDELINTDRVNFFATFGKDQAKLNRDELWNLYRKTYNNFARKSEGFINSLKADCVKCSSNIRYAQVTP